MKVEVSKPEKYTAQILELLRTNGPTKAKFVSEKLGISNGQSNVSLRFLVDGGEVVRRQATKEEHGSFGKLPFIYELAKK